MNGKIQRIPAGMYEEARSMADEIKRNSAHIPIVCEPMDVIRAALRRGLDAMKADRAGGAR
tara:strand:- start:1843 stop:2025 length:183 start_codon:yes stop_codon:yes gene_type:complete